MGRTSRKTTVLGCGSWGSIVPLAFVWKLPAFSQRTGFKRGIVSESNASQFGHSRGASWQLRQLTGQMYPALSSDQTDTLVETPPVSMRLLMAPEYDWVEKKSEDKMDDVCEYTYGLII